MTAKKIPSESFGGHFTRVEFSAVIVPQSCPRFSGCNANICPLDQDWHKRTHLRGEPVCGLLRNWAKHLAQPSEGCSVPPNLIPAISEAHPQIVASNGHIRRALKKAAKTPAKSVPRAA